MDLYEVSDYFVADELKATCMDFLRNTEIHQSFCLQMLSFAMRHDISDIIMKAISFISNDADNVLSNSEEAAQLPSTFLKYMFQSSDLTVSEITLVKIVLELSAKPDAELRAELIPHIRLPRVSAKEMMKVIVPSGLFDQDVCMQSLAFQVDSDSVSLPAEATADRRQPPQYQPPSRAVWRRRTIFADGFAAFLQALTGDGCSEEVHDSEVDVEDNDGGLQPRDIELVMAQVACTRSRAVNALHANNRDVVEAIMQLSSAWD